MKITNEQLRRIIKEEIEAVFQEARDLDGKYERKPFAGTDGPMSMEFGNDTGNLVLINFGIKEGLPQDFVSIKLSDIENNFRDALTSAPISEKQVNNYMKSYKDNMINYNIMTGDAWHHGLTDELVKKLGANWDTILDRDLLWNKLTQRGGRVSTGGGKGVRNLINREMLPDGASLEGDQTTQGDRVTVDEPTME